VFESGPGSACRQPNFDPVCPAAANPGSARGTHPRCNLTAFSVQIPAGAASPITEAEQYYSALKLMKVESVLVRVPGEPHGLSMRPSHQAAKAMYVLDWFEKHRAK
jgi:hypothetical protein